MLVPFNPWNELSRLEREMDSFLRGRQLSALAGNGDPRRPVEWAPAVDIHDDAAKIQLTADLPGVEQKDVEISVENNVLTLRGERKAEQKGDADGYHRYERVYGSFTRAFTLPSTVDTEKVSAEMKNGVLTVTLPKRPEAQPRTIKINVA